MVVVVVMVVVVMVMMKGSSAELCRDQAGMESHASRRTLGHACECPNSRVASALPVGRHSEFCEFGIGIENSQLDLISELK